VIAQKVLADMPRNLLLAESPATIAAGHGQPTAQQCKQHPERRMVLDALDAITSHRPYGRPSDNRICHNSN
jgi:hypothetical protein